MKKCSYCGNELKDDDKFCSACGNEVKEKETSSLNHSNEENHELMSTEPVNSKKRSWKQRLLIILGSVLIFIGLFLFPIIGPLAIEYAIGTLVILTLGIIILVFGLKKPKNPNV